MVCDGIKFLIRNSHSFMGFLHIGTVILNWPTCDGGNELCLMRSEFGHVGILEMMCDFIIAQYPIIELIYNGINSLLAT